MEKKEFNAHALYIKDIMTSLYMIYLLKNINYMIFLLLDFQC